MKTEREKEKEKEKERKTQKHIIKVYKARGRENGGLRRGLTPLQLETRFGHNITWI